MTILHMETEAARDVGLRLDQTAGALDDKYLVLKSILGNLSSAWEGGRADRFEQSLKSCLNELRARVEELQSLSRRLRLEVDEWEQAAAEFGTGGSSAYMLGQMSAAVVGMTAAVATVAEIIRARADFKALWDTWTLEERTAYLQGLQDAYAKKNGISPIKIYVQDINDPPGMDARGYRTSGVMPEIKGPSWLKGIYLGWLYRWHKVLPQNALDHIVLDIDNVMNSDPYQVQETLFHESRHQVQHVVAQDPAHPPAGISQTTAQEWKDNLDDYKSPADDYEAYRNQPVEADARAAGAAETDALYAGGTS